MSRTRVLDRGSKDEGFTLIELMVVVLIIGILVAIALPTFLGARTRAAERAAEANLRNGMTAAKIYFTDGATYTGFNVGTNAAQIEPSLNWVLVDGPDSVGTLTINYANGGDIVMSSKASTGGDFCIAADVAGGGGVLHGKNDGTGAASAADCINVGW